MARTTHKFSLVLALFIGAVALTGSAQAASFDVDSTVDAVDVNLGDGICDAGPGAGNQCTLRAAIMQANALGNGPHLVRLVGDTYSLTISGAQENQSATGDLDITASIQVTGMDAAFTVIDGYAQDRVFDIHSGGKLALMSLSVVNGASGSAEGGGAIRSMSAERSSLLGVRIADSVADGDGGGLLALSTLWDIEQTSFEGNHASSGRGGAIYNSGEALALVGVGILGNRASGSSGGLGSGGGIYSENASTLRLTNSTVSGNLAEQDGGGIAHASDSTAVLSHVTVVDNEAETGDGGGLYHQGAGTTVGFGDSVLAHNRAAVGSGPNCFSSSSSLQSLGNNLVDDATGCSLAGDLAGNLTGVLPRLAPLRNDGGNIYTHAPLVGSPLIDAGAATCVDALGAVLSMDQRGLARPVDVDEVGGVACDMGSVELGSNENNVVVDCLDGSAWESIDRGFYMQSYAVDSLGSVEVAFTPEVAGEHTVRLTIRNGSFDGTVLGSVAEIFTLPSADPISFDFILNGLTGSTLAFELEGESLPAGATDLFYDAGLCDDPGACAFCPDLFQTVDTAAPLFSVLRGGAGVRILTAVPEPSMGLLQGAALLSLLAMTGARRKRK